MPAKVAHLTTVHPRYDTRIFFKECRSLASNGFEVLLLVADGGLDEVKDGVSIASVGKRGGRVRRMLSTTLRMYSVARRLDVDVYHFHDPELLPVGLLLRRTGRAVIFDAHEDVASQILSKHYLWKPVRRLGARFVGAAEAWICRRLTAVVAATPFILEKFLPVNPASVAVNNFPMLAELGEHAPTGAATPTICYVGGITESRGIREMVRAIGMVQGGVTLQVAGRFNTQSLASEVHGMEEWSRVSEHGWLDRSGVRDLLQSSTAGLVVLHPILNYLDALPVKMFEYMCAGLPVIASDFPLWRRIVEKNRCGICVDPMNPAAIAKAIDWMVSNPDAAREMGENGRRAVVEQFNWGIEERKLLELYGRCIPASCQ